MTQFPSFPLLLPGSKSKTSRYFLPSTNAIMFISFMTVMHIFVSSSLQKCGALLRFTGFAMLFTSRPTSWTQKTKIPCEKNMRSKQIHVPFDRDIPFGVYMTQYSGFKRSNPGVIFGFLKTGIRANSGYSRCLHGRAQPGYC